MHNVAAVLAILVMAGTPVIAQDANDINSRFENLRAYSRFGNDYLSVHPNDLFLAIPFGGTGDKVPGKARSKFEKGNQFLLKDQFDKAKQQYEAALAEYPDYASAHLNLGVTELNLKDVAHARQEFQTACKLNPQLPNAYQNLGLLEILQQDYAAAEPPLRDANRLDPKDLKTLTLLAYAEALNKKYEEAILTARRVHDFKEHTPAYAYAHMIAATALESSDKRADAIKEYKQFLIEAPNDPRANIARKELEQLESIAPAKQ